MLKYFANFYPFKTFKMMMKTTITTTRFDSIYISVTFLFILLRNLIIINYNPPKKIIAVAIALKIIIIKELEI